MFFLGESRVGFFTRRDVQPFEELNFDYKYERYGQAAQKCFCGTSLCRKGSSPFGDLDTFLIQLKVSLLFELPNTIEQIDLKYIFQTQIWFGGLI